MSPAAVLATRMQLTAALEIIGRETTGVPERFAWAARFVVRDRAGTIEAMGRRLRDRSELKAALASISDPVQRTSAARAARTATKNARAARARELAAEGGLTREQIGQRIAIEEGRPLEPFDESVVRRWLREQVKAGIL